LTSSRPWMTGIPPRVPAVSLLMWAASWAASAHRNRRDTHRQPRPTAAPAQPFPAARPPCAPCALNSMSIESSSTAKPTTCTCSCTTRPPRPSRRSRSGSKALPPTRCAANTPAAVPSPTGADTSSPCPTSPSPAQAHHRRPSSNTWTANPDRPERRAAPGHRRDVLTPNQGPRLAPKKVPVRHWHAWPTSTICRSEAGKRVCGARGSWSGAAS
jgi:hypothetical protein